ncbi:uncharacterized protein LOC134821179 isoform X3 [Bolinopsis microptera]|uniref:uncharacterized protein LOC134821179 isoform X3 n=1 Tax=Bolinopsis microptera TaxID=2820187 RepID=UPI00307ABD42
MLHPRAALCGSVLCQVRNIVRSTLPVRSSTPCYGPNHARHLSSLTGQKEQSTEHISFVNQPSDMRSLRREIIRRIGQRFPMITVEMPMYGSLFREDIVVQPSTSPEIERYLDAQFSKYTSTIMKIPPSIDFDREHVLLQKPQLGKKFDYPISMAVKDRNVFLTAHKNEIQRLKIFAENLVRSEILVEVISDMDEETYSAVMKSSDYLVPKKFEKFAKPVQFDKGSIVIKGNQEALAAISYRVEQVIKYQCDPFKDSIPIPGTVGNLLQNNLNQDDLFEKEFEKFPSEWFENSYLCEYQTETRLLDRYQTVVAKRILRSDLETGSALLSAISDGSTSLELSFPKAAGRGPLSCLRHIQNMVNIPFANPVIGQYLKVSGQNLSGILRTSNRLSNVNTHLDHDGVILFGGKWDDRRLKSDKIKSAFDALIVVEVPFPHPVFRRMIVGEDGSGIRNFSKKHPGIFSFVAEDSSKITLVTDGKKKVSAEKLAETLHERIGGLGYKIYSKTRDSAVLFRLDEPELKNYSYQNKVSIQKVLSSDSEMDSWLIYGKKEAVQNFMKLVERKEEEAYKGKITRNVQVTKDYNTWHSFVLYARELNSKNGRTKCLYNDNLRSPPGQISMVGPPAEVESAFEDLQSLEQQILKQSLQDDPELISEISDISQDDLRIAGNMKFTFPNTKISTKADKTGLVVSSSSSASLRLAEEYVRRYFGDAEELKFFISDKHWVFLKSNWPDVKDFLERTCLNRKVRYKRDLQNRSLSFYGHPSNTTMAKENLDKYFLTHHGIGDLLQADDEDIWETVEIDKNKLEAILDPHLGNFRATCNNVSLQTLLGKMGSTTSYIRLKSANKTFLKEAADNLRKIESEIFLNNYEMNQSTYYLVKVIERASPNYSWLFPKKSKQVRVTLDKNTPQFHIAYKSNADFEEAHSELVKHFESLEYLEEIQLPTKKMGKVMTEVIEYIDILENKNDVKAIISETENKIIVFGKNFEVEKTTEKLSTILNLRDWEVFEVQLAGCNDVKTAVQIRAQIQKIFPYLMVDQIPNHGYKDTESDITLRISTLVEKMKQYPATKQQLNHFISQSKELD